MKITLDTNVLISGSFWTGDSFKILELIDSHKIECILSKDILDEYFRVAKSDELVEKIKDKHLVILKTIESIIRNSIIVAPTKKLDVVKDDPDDNKILECAVEGNTDFVITQDKHLLKLKKFGDIQIITPKEFLGVFQKT